MIEAYWNLLYMVGILTGIGYFYLIRFKVRYGDNAPKWVKALLIPQVIIFLFLDWFLNILLTIPLIDLPETTFELTTARMKRYKRLPTKIPSSMDKGDWMRYDLAVWVCKQLNRGEKDHC